MIYTLKAGYDRQLKQRVERTAAYGLPLAIIGVIGIASLTSNVTHITNQPPAGTTQGTQRTANDRQKSVAGQWKATAAPQQSSNAGSTALGSSRPKQSTSSSVSTVSNGGSVSVTTPTGGGKGSGATIINPAPLIQDVVPVNPVTTPITDTATDVLNNTTPNVNLEVDINALTTNVSVDATPVLKSIDGIL